MDNMEIYNKVRRTPNEARKQIEAGRLAGYTDINPMWRIKKLTEIFGPCGSGWKYEVINTRILDGGSKVYEHGKGETFSPVTVCEKCVFVDVLLRYRLDDGSWSEGVFGTGGAHYVSTEKNAPYTDDDAFKKATTDALGNACKYLGMSADIFFAADADGKYVVGELEEDIFKKRVTRAESKQIVDAAKEKWGAQAAEKCNVILKNI